MHPWAECDTKQPSLQRSLGLQGGNMVQSPCPCLVLRSNGSCLIRFRDFLLKMGRNCRMLESPIRCSNLKSFRCLCRGDTGPGWYAWRRERHQAQSALWAVGKVCASRRLFSGPLKPGLNGPGQGSARPVSGELLLWDNLPWFNLIFFFFNMTRKSVL